LKICKDYQDEKKGKKKKEKEREKKFLTNEEK
jgi:hypothetical protein